MNDKIFFFLVQATGCSHWECHWSHPPGTWIRKTILCFSKKIFQIRIKHFWLKSSHNIKCLIIYFLIWPYICSKVWCIHVHDFCSKAYHHILGIFHMISIISRLVFFFFLLWCQKWIRKTFGEFYVETVNIKVVDNYLNYNLSETIFIKLDLGLCRLFLDAP